MSKYIIVYDFLIATLLIAGTAYIVFWMNNSGWWFLLTCILLEETLISPIEIKSKEQQ